MKTSMKNSPFLRFLGGQGKGRDSFTERLEHTDTDNET